MAGIHGHLGSQVPQLQGRALLSGSQPQRHRSLLELSFGLVLRPPAGLMLGKGPAGCVPSG